MNDDKRQVGLITGASSGIGWAIAHASQRFVCVLWWSLSSGVILHRGPRFGPEFQRLRLLVCKRAARNRYG